MFISSNLSSLLPTVVTERRFQGQRPHHQLTTRAYGVTGYSCVIFPCCVEAVPGCHSTSGLVTLVGLCCSLIWIWGSLRSSNPDCCIPQTPLILKAFSHNVKSETILIEKLTSVKGNVKKPNRVMLEQNNSLI